MSARLLADPDPCPICQRVHDGDDCGGAYLKSLRRPTLAEIDARHRLKPWEQDVLERADEFVRVMATVPKDQLPVIPYEDLEAAVLARRRAEGRE